MSKRGQTRRVRVMGICSNRPECCDGDPWRMNDINETYALTHTYCYPAPKNPLVNPDPTSNVTNSTRPIPFYNTTIPVNGFNFSNVEAAKDRIVRETQERIYLYITMPLQLSKITGSISIVACILTLFIFLMILIYQPIM